MSWLPSGRVENLSARAKEGQGGIEAAQCEGGRQSQRRCVMTILREHGAEKEVAAIDRKLARLQQEIATAHERLAVHDQSDFAGITRLSAELQDREAMVADLETRWIEVSEALEV